MLVEQMLPVARKRLFIVRHDAPLIQAVSPLGNVDSDLLVVCNDDHRLAGVIMKTDIVRKIGNCGGNSCRESIAAAMNGDVVSCEPGARLHDVRLAMKKRGLKNVPVVDADTRPLGVLNPAMLSDSLFPRPSRRTIFFATMSPVRDIIDFGKAAQ